LEFRQLCRAAEGAEFVRKPISDGIPVQRCGGERRVFSESLAEVALLNEALGVMEETFWAIERCEQAVNVWRYQLVCSGVIEAHERETGRQSFGHNISVSF
jgi:hypothetical protein